ncbi:MAG: GNAT family N-acetyltransferase [Natrialbaceae archaeon]|nr:GNAT family N-acetyltransferase [Natrialbaceae archaeon]
MVSVRTLDLTNEAEHWDRVVQRSPGANPFASSAALKLLAAETGTEVHALLGEVGEEPIGMFPVFVYRRGPIAASFSPPPYSWSCYLGPSTVNLSKLKQRKAERRTKRFLEGCISWVTDTVAPVYSRYVAAEFPDVRPFVWNGFDVEPGYTYVVDLSPENLLSRFSRDARQNIRSAEAEASTIEEGSRAAVATIISQVAERYERQGKSFHLSPEFAQQLYDTLPDGTLRPYVCRVDGQIQGGILVVESERSIYRWQGGVRPSDPIDIPINDLLDWHVMCEGQSRGRQRYDLVGAGVQSINRYKAKFNPDLEPYYTITDGTFGLDRLVDRYRKLG